MPPSIVAAWRAGAPWRSPAALLGLAAVAAARLLTLPRSLWELDEVLFVRGVELFDPVQHRPHPPGYPLTVGLGKLFALVTGDPFHALVVSSVIASLIGYLALVDAYTRMAAPLSVGANDESGGAAGDGRGDRWGREACAVGVAAALLFHLSPPMLLYGPLALSDAPTLAFLALALAASTRLRAGGVRAAVAMGAFAAAAVGCRPQLGVAVVAMLIVACVAAAARIGWRPHGGRVLLAAAAGFAVIALSWLVPLVLACGGIEGFLALLGRQAGLVAGVDAESARSALSAPALVARFVAHPWGPKQLSGPLLLMAVVGLVAVMRWLLAAASPQSGGRRRMTSTAAALLAMPATPLLVLSGADLAFALLVMDPADAPRYALPSLLAVAFLAVLGLSSAARFVRALWLAWVGTAALVGGFVAFTWPILYERTTTFSPPVQAARWAEAHVPRSALVLVSPPLLPHAAQLLGGREFVVANPGPSPRGTIERRPAFLFADGESGWPGAVAFRWQRSEAWGKLTRGYYRVVSWSALPDCRIEAVSGVYGWEPGWRWLDREAVLRVETRRVDTGRVEAISGPAGHVEAERRREFGVTLGLPPTSPHDEVNVDVALGGTVPARLRVTRASRRTIWLPLSEPAPRWIDVRFAADRDFVPAAAGGSTDRRRLAVQLVSCAFRDGG